MSFHIGDNIRALRKSKDVTQEQLAEFLGISNAAISKWERGETYPDISLLPVLAKFFNVSIDELMDYDISRNQEKIQNIESEYWRLWKLGKFEETSELIKAARQQYYDDYTIMYLYMHNVVGGWVAVDNAKVLERKDELLHLCNMILRGCTIERIRLEAINIKAKILLAIGNKEGAIEALKVLPHFSGTVELKTEQLFEYHSNDSREWVARNTFSLAEGYATKLVKKIWFDPTLDIKKKILYAEQLGDGFSHLYEVTKEVSMLVLAYKFWASLSIRVIGDWCADEDVVRVKEKELGFARKLDQVAINDHVLKERIVQHCHGKSLLSWVLQFLDTAPQKTYERLRQSDKFKEMLEKYR